MRGPGPEDTDDGGDGSDGGTPHRRVERRRTYNRRLEDREVAPPYFDVFERIAVALEHIEARMTAAQVTLPDVPVRPPAERP